MKANIESDNSVTSNLAALDFDRLRLLDPLIALRPRSTARNACVKIIISPAPNENKNKNLLVVYICRESRGQLYSCQEIPLRRRTRTHFASEVLQVACLHFASLR